MNIRFSHILAITLLMALSSCAPKPGIPTQSVYTFQNGTNQKITLDLYESKGDYDSGVNRLSRIFLKPATEGDLTMQVGHTYYLDWYSEDYSANNWGFEGAAGPGNNPSPAAQIKGAAEANYILIRQPIKDASRKVLLGTGTQSNWRLVIDDSSEVAGNYEFLFQKSFAGTYTFTDKAGVKTVKDFTFRVEVNGNRFHMILQTDGAGLFDIRYANLDVMPLGSLQDSLFVSLDTGIRALHVVQRQ